MFLSYSEILNESATFHGHYVNLKQLQRVFCWVTQQDSRSASKTESTYKAERERETFRREVRAGFGPDSYLETPACFLFFLACRVQKPELVRKHPREIPWRGLRQTSTVASAQTRWADTPDTPALSSAMSGALSSSSASSWMTPSSSWLPASHKKGPCW